MNLIVRLLLAALVALVVAGCATSGSGTKYAQAEAKLSAPAAGTGRIVIYREMGPGFLVQPSVTLNGTVIGTAVPDAVFYVDRPKGNYEVACSTEVEKKASFTLEDGETKYVRLSIAMGLLVGRVVPELVSADEAKKAIAELPLITANAGK